ncbi:MAG: hypothetical protein JO252_10515 [Planctomycetaceae bacterium]|nr:hypothetical protein [Planctomycetaceae bacterium]
MIHIFCRSHGFGRKSRSAHGRRKPRASPEIAPLEGRAPLAILGLSAQASPALIRPINPMNQPKGLITVTSIRPITLSGYVAESGTATPTVTFRVVDQFGRDQPSGTLTPQLVTAVNPATNLPIPPATYFFNGRIGLSLAHPPGGSRQYTLIVTANDGAETVSTTLIVPPATFFHRHRSIPLNLS